MNLSVCRIAAVAQMSQNRLPSLNALRQVIEHNQRLWFVGRRPNGGPLMSSTSDHHSDYEAGQVVLFCVASIVILVFAWAVVAY